jgi:hypothetical protein
MPLQTVAETGHFRGKMKRARNFLLWTIAAVLSFGCMDDNNPITSENDGRPNVRPNDASADATTPLPFTASVRPAQDMPVSQLVVPGPAKFMSVVVANPSDTAFALASVKVSQIHPGGDVTDCTEVTTTYANQVLTRSSAPTGDTWETAPDPGATLIIAAGTERTIGVVCNVAVPITTDDPPETSHGMARSGHTPQFRIDELTVTGVDGRSATIQPLLTGSAMTVRLVQPVIHLNPSTETALADGVMPLISWDMSCANTDCSWTGMVFNLQKSGGVKLSDFRLRRGYTDVDFDRYLVLWTNGHTDFRTVPMDEVVTDAQFGLIFPPPNEETVDSARYALYATVSGASTSGRFISIQLGTGLPPSVSNTGWLFWTKFPMVAFGTTPEDANHIDSSFLTWSDRSAGSQHSAAYGIDGGSRDFIDDTFIAMHDLRQGVTISN